MSKVHPLAHHRAAIFGRGMAQIIAEAAVLVGLSPQLCTIEQVAEAMPKLLRLVTVRYCRSADIEDPRAYGLAEVYLVPRVGLVHTFFRRRLRSTPRPASAVPNSASDAGSGTSLTTTTMS